MNPERAKQIRAYAILRPIFLKAHPFCEVMECCCKSTEIHHKKGRHGELLTDERWLLAVCQRCHQMIEDNKRGARKLGYILYK